jgi:hypothetical protein
MLIDKAIPRLAFSNPTFVKALMRQFTGEQRQRIVDTLAYQAHRLGGGVFAGSPAEYIAQKEKRFREAAAALPDDPGLEDLARAMRRFT